MQIRNKAYEKLVDFVRENPGQFTYGELAKKFNLTYNQVKGRIAGENSRDFTLEVKQAERVRYTIQTPQTKRFKMNLQKRNPKNVLVVGDLHEPFSLSMYLEFCKDMYKKYDCTHVIFIGDIIDNHFTSFHDTDPDGMSAYDELYIATTRVAKWVEAFPQADVCIGNHDRLIARKAFASGISALWLRDYNEVLKAPGWDFQDEFIYNNVRYIHGEQGSAKVRAKKDLISTVQGHRHQEAYTEHMVGQTYHIFGTQVGCGVDRKAYAMAYAKAGSKPVIGCAVILNHGTLPINLLLDL